MTSPYRLMHNVALTRRNTFGVHAHAQALAEVDDARALPALLDEWQRQSANARIFVLGGGSNVLITDDFDGLIIAPRMRGIEVVRDDAHAVVLRVGAGEGWNDCVRWTLDHHMPGLENLSLIPGHVGAAPIQNIGAYGVDIAEFIDHVEAYDLDQGRFVTLAREACQFGYRDSVFKHHPERWVVTHVVMRLPKKPRLRTDYNGLQAQLAHTRTPTARDVAQAVITLRQRKLPDPAETPSAGSFFKNPIVDCAQADALQKAHPQMPRWTLNNGRVKLSAAWLIEHCGFKGYRDGDAGVADSHALVLVNHGHASGAQLWALAQHIQAVVSQRFDVGLHPEPRILFADVRQR